MSLLLQDMEHNLRVSLNSKPSLTEIETLIKEEISNLRMQIRADLEDFQKAIANNCIDAAENS